MPLWSARCVAGDTPSDNPEHGAEDGSVRASSMFQRLELGPFTVGACWRQVVWSGKEEWGNSGRDFDTLTASTDCDVVHLEQYADGLRWESLGSRGVVAVRPAQLWKTKEQGNKHQPEQPRHHWHDVPKARMPMSEPSTQYLSGSAT